jgi:hypothetical protein
LSCVYPQLKEIAMAIKQEKVNGTLRLCVGPRINWLALFVSLLLLLIIWGAGMEPAFEGFIGALGTTRSIGGYLLGMAALSALSLFLAYGILLNLFGSEVICVTSSELDIQFKTLSWIRSRRSVPNSTVEQLRYEEWPVPRAGVQHGIRFDCVGETTTFAMSATTSECYAIIDQMRQVYDFSVPDPSEAEPSPAVTNW